MNEELRGKIDQRSWFYAFDLPDGSQTESYLPKQAQAIHDTRLAMVAGILRPLIETGPPLTALDLASHQGWFSLKLAELGCAEVTGLEPRAEHVKDARLMAEACGRHDVAFVEAGIEDIANTGIETADVVLMLGLLYHLENPISAIRAARAYCKRVCLIETQVGPHLGGVMDWGSADFIKPIEGCFSVIDETDETHGNEASTDGICLVPSAQTLLWVMEKVGFKQVKLVMPDEDAYEQHRYHKRVLAVGWV
ncbi:MAG: class I SAM-dependent methyltransferase [Wenzhouxiangella sp.]|nr:class I SAM-dependent methyltransferase [Wenzhouxiangella sp.]